LIRIAPPRADRAGGQKKELMIFEGYGGQSLFAEKGKIRMKHT